MANAALTWWLLVAPLLLAIVDWVRTPRHPLTAADQDRLARSMAGRRPSVGTAPAQFDAHRPSPLPSRASSRL